MAGVPKMKRKIIIRLHNDIDKEDYDVLIWILDHNPAVRYFDEKAED